MNIKFKFILSFLLIHLVIYTSAQNTGAMQEIVNDTLLVKEVFQHYKTSILNDRGEEAANTLDSRTIKYYERMLDIVKHSDSASVAKLTILDKFSVLTMRLKISKPDLVKMTGRDLIIYSIDHGMVGKNSVSNLSIGNVTVNDGFARGEYLSAGKSSNLYLHFYKENSVWKIDLTSIFKASEIAFKQAVEKSKLSENDFILKMLEIASHTKPDNSIWKPVF